jgi:hypothetical protein
MSAVRVSITRYLSDDPQPGWIECRLSDVWGREWIFEDKPPIFSECYLSVEDTYPRPGVIRCEIVGRRWDADGREIVTVDTETPDHVESTTGETRFDVREGQLADEA